MRNHPFVGKPSDPKGDEMGKDQPDSLSPHVIAVVADAASENFKDMMKDEKRGIMITRDTALQYVFSSFPKFQLRRTITMLAEHYGIAMPDDAELGKLFASIKSVGDIQGWVDARLAEKEGVQEKVPVQTKKSKVAIA